MTDDNAEMDALADEMEPARLITIIDDAHGISPALITETPQVSTRAGSGGV